MSNYCHSGAAKPASSAPSSSNVSTSGAAKPAVGKYTLADPESSDDDLDASRLCELTYEMSWTGPTLEVDTKAEGHASGKWSRYRDPLSREHWWSGPAGTNWFWEKDAKWCKYTDPVSGAYWWRSPAGTNWFWEEGSTWAKFRDPVLERCWWYSQADWFFSDTGLHV
jgi:hypothetical protein